MFTVLTLVLLCFLLCIMYAVREQVKARGAYKLPPSLPGELPIIGHTHILMEIGKDLWSFVKKVSACAVEKKGVIYCRFFHIWFYFITDPEDALTVANSCLEKPFVYDFAKNWLGEGFLTSTVTTFGADIKGDNFIQNYSNAIQEMMDIYMKKFTKLSLQSNFIYALLGYQKKEDLLINTLRKLTTKTIQQKKAAIKNNNMNVNDPDLLNNPDATYKSLADYMLELQGLLTEEEIKEELDTSISAASDTVSHTLVNIMVFLGTHPEVQDKLYDEFIEVLGADKDVEKNDLKKLVYTKAVIKETLRVLPTVPAYARYIDKDVKLKSYTLPAKSICMIMPYGIHRSAAWGPDAEQFRPERWLDPATLPSKTNYFATFSMGRRSCLGVTYAITELTVILAHLVRRCRWTADAAGVKMQLYVTLQPTEGHQINIERRTTDD